MTLDSDSREQPLHSYILLRSDMPLEAQMAQCAHAAQEAAFLLGSPPLRPIHVVVLSCPDEASLLAAGERLAKRGVDARLFHEPDWPRGHTALYSRPQPRGPQLSSAMGRYPLWSAPSASPPPIRVDATPNPLNATIEISPRGESMARLCHLLQKTGVELSDRLHGLRSRLEAAGVPGGRDLDALDALADLIDSGSGPEAWAKACDSPASGYARFREALAQPHAGDCTAIESSCRRCWAESALGIDTAPPTKADGHRMLRAQMAPAPPLPASAAPPPASASA